MSNAFLIKMSIHYGPFYGALFSLLPFLIHKGGLNLVLLFGNIAAMTVFFFILYKCTFAVFWNRRAHRMAEESLRIKIS